MKEIAGDAGSAEWESSKKASSRGASSKNDWLADSIAKADAKKRAESKKSSTGVSTATPAAEAKTVKQIASPSRVNKKQTERTGAVARHGDSKSSSKFLAIKKKSGLKKPA
jgi:hypothetical protein